MKIHYYILIAVLICLVSVNAQNKIKLKFDNHGEFKIVQFTDTHINLEKKSNLNVYEIVESVINIEKPDLVIFTGDIVTEADFNKIDWVTGADSEGIAITTNTCPHSEIDWAKFKTEYDKL